MLGLLLALPVALPLRLSRAVRDCEREREALPVPDAGREAPLETLGDGVPVPPPPPPSVALPLVLGQGVVERVLCVSFQATRGEVVRRGEEEALWDTLELALGRGVGVSVACRGVGVGQEVGVTAWRGIVEDVEGEGVMLGEGV